ncbi:hypothetical protein L1987_48354 [Smallanthus sonchifolius]|uniref:Uncharacterized protein n=1 Tax=Smallanthus sonchifolius TaxID=185202 RepID=A0ACB9FRF3_9ASTR|nr:hypothetical protein L1987_48354 [Smallanthus sonchifolius]
MDDNYDCCYEGYQYDYEYHYSEVWCEICGEAHYTQDCYHYQGYSIYFHQPYWKPYEETTLPQEIQHPALDSDSWTPGNLFRHLVEIKVQFIKCYPTEQQNDPFKIQESEIIASRYLVGQVTLKSKYLPASQEWIRRLETKQSKEPEERRSKEESVVILTMEAQEGYREQTGVPVTSKTTSYEEPDCETNIKEEIMEEKVITNKQMTMVAPPPCNSDSWPVTKHISESFHESHKP